MMCKVKASVCIKHIAHCEHHVDCFIANLVVRKVTARL
jgi:hypothetical protein